MIRKIQLLLFIFIIAAAGVTISCQIFFQFNLRQGFLDQINKEQEDLLGKLLVHAYELKSNGSSWDFIKKPPTDWPHSLQYVLPVWEIESRLILLDADRNLILGGNYSPDDHQKMTPLVKGSETLGYFHLRRKVEIADSANRTYFTRQKYGALILSGPVLLVCVILSMFAARRLLRPIHALACGIKLLAEGDYSARIPVSSLDELGQLSNDFNSLALLLESNEKNRQQLVADIAHDLRTPLMILQGEIKALKDGVRPVTTEAMDSLNEEVSHLRQMVDDLYQLSQYDISALHYDKEEVDPIKMLQRITDKVRPQFAAKGVTLTLTCPPPTASMLADRKRLHQLFSNLFDNSLKYTDPGGRLEVIAEYRQGAVVIQFQDSAPSVPDQDLPLIFDRQYRVKNSRNRSSNGSGLGLAICRCIVQAHEGTIEADKSILGGLAITITLPVV
ncbi:MAG: ATP-binding protein [Desulfobulbaceae bacterium]|nr:ATP-binding protein [Desulfobulbaceae bacterium]